MLSFIVCFSLSSDAIANAEVVNLNDQTFEHQTQASTGATTGSWLVLFGIPNCDACEQLKPLLVELGSDEELYENGVVLGSVDCLESSGVCHRFSISSLPVVIYLHNKRLYRYPRDEEFGSLPAVDDLKAFALRDFAQKSEAEVIPDPPSPLEAFMKPIMAIYKQNPLAGYAIFGMAGMMAFTTLLLLVVLVKGSGKSSDTDKKVKTKNKSSKKNK